MIEFFENLFSMTIVFTKKNIEKIINSFILSLKWTVYQGRFHDILVLTEL